MNNIMALKWQRIHGNMGEVMGKSDALSNDDLSEWIRYKLNSQTPIISLISFGENASLAHAVFSMENNKQELTIAKLLRITKIFSIII